ncbi:MAG: hypothetical protein AVDCRST_MAG25-1508, partial [uncultured Rubrobacteraceae bacterium]
AGGRKVRLQLTGGFQGCCARGLARPGALLPQARPGRRVARAGALYLGRPVPQPPPRRASAGAVALRVQLRPPLRGARGAGRRARPRAPSRRGARGARPHDPGRFPLAPQVPARLQGLGLRLRDRAGALDPLRPHLRHPIRPLRRHRGRKGSAVYRLQTRGRRGPPPARGGAPDPAAPHRPRRGTRAPHKPARQL